MSILKRIVKAEYQTTDGKTFNDKGEAAKHQAHLNRLSSIEEMLKAQLPTTEDGYLDAVGVDGVARFIVENADALREILPKRAKSEKGAETPAAPASTTGAAIADSLVTSTLAEVSAEQAQVPVVGGVTTHDHAHKHAAAQPFHFPAGLVETVTLQANA